MPTTTRAYATVRVAHDVMSVIGDRAVMAVPSDVDPRVSDVVWSDTGYWSGVTITRSVDGCDYVRRDDHGGVLVFRRFAARSTTTIVTRAGLTDVPEPVATFGDSPRAYPQATDLGWFTHPDRETSWVIDGSDAVDVYTELAFAYL